MILANAAKKALRTRSVQTVTIWDNSGMQNKIVHTFTALGTSVEIQAITSDWCKLLQRDRGFTDAEMMRWFSYVVETIYRTDRHKV